MTAFLNLKNQFRVNFRFFIYYALFQEALKLNFENIKIRENYMLSCLRTRDIPSAVSAFHGLLDVDKQYKDDKVIELLTQKLAQLRCVSDIFCLSSRTILFCLIVDILLPPGVFQVRNCHISPRNPGNWYILSGKSELLCSILKALTPSR